MSIQLGRKLAGWWTERGILPRINSLLIRNTEIKIAKARDYSDTGIHWYYFSYLAGAEGKKIKGVGADYSDRTAVLRAWGEFVERYSFTFGDGRPRTTNGFASHTSLSAARAAAMAELVERDVFLCCWLSRRPAARLGLGTIPVEDRRRLQALRELGFRTDFGVFGRCMGLVVGIVFIHSDRHLVIATSAKATTQELLAHLVREAAITVSDLRSPAAQKPIAALPEKAAPLDHLRCYLEAPAGPFVRDWLSDAQDIIDFPAFTVAYDDLTPGNTLARETGYYVVRASSEECQDMWFGTTRRDLIKIERVRCFAGPGFREADLNYAPHPLA